MNNQELFGDIYSEDCLFCKMAKGEVPCEKVYEDDDILAFHDIKPQASVHILIIPKKHITNVNCLKPEDDATVGKIFRLASKLGGKFGLDDGFRIVVNTGKHAGQTVFHIHFHVIGGDYMTETMA